MIVKGDPQVRISESLNHVSKEAKDFLTGCLTRDPSRRFDCAQALKHPWITKLKHAGATLNADQK